MDAAKTLAGGLLGLIVAAGVGAAFIRLLGPIPGRWRLALMLLSGVAILDLTVMLVLFLGGGLGAVKLAGIAAAGIGCGALLVSRKRLSFTGGLKVSNPDRWFVAVIAVVAAIDLAIAVAPSTKIDELHYHMLVPKRVLQDGGLHLYREPFESAIFPQMAFQLGLTAEHAAGFPEAGNVVSWGLSIALICLVAAVTTGLTGSTTAGWITGAISAVGLYPAVWHVTSGPHALGDLAMVTACLLALLPDAQTGELTPKAKLILLCLAAYVAASTRISNLPLAAIITLIGVRRAAAQLGWRKAGGIALAVWSALYGPILLWTTMQCGSPWGIATASLLHSHYFGAESMARMRDAKNLGPKGWTPLPTWLIPSVSAGMIAAFGIVAWAAFKRQRIAMAVSGLVCGQAILIAWLLPREFRFLGGLQYVVVIVAAWIFWPSRFGTWIAARWWVVLLGLCLPWLAVQAYYARPFMQVDLGLVSRDSFRNQYVAFSDDFRALDRVLPGDAVLYVTNTRLPAYYAPRPVIFTLEDLRGRGPLYRFRVVNSSPPPVDSLSCPDTVYESPQAVAAVYRTPGKQAIQAPLVVERCK